MSSILVVDDEPMVARLLRTRLESRGHDVEVASNGAEALERLQSGRHQVLVTDVCMPRMTGRELCEAVRKSAANDDLWIFVSSSRPEDEMRAWTRDLRRTEFLEKPVSLKHLVERIEHCLSRGDSDEADEGDEADEA